MINIAQFGCGYWGPNLLRNFDSLKNCNVKIVVEPDKGRQKFITESFQHIDLGVNLTSAVTDPSINAVVIATPAHLHFEQAKLSLQAGKHVFVEKPMATTGKEVEELIKLADARNLVLMSGHTFLYNDAVIFIKQQIDSGEIGDVRYIYSQRLNLGRIRSDVDALWNFAPHDVSVIQFLLNDRIPLEINSHGMDFIQSGVNDVSFLTLKYDSTIANIHVSWLDPLKLGSSL